MLAYWRRREREGVGPSCDGQRWGVGIGVLGARLGEGAERVGGEGGGDVGGGG